MRKLLRWVLPMLVAGILLFTLDSRFFAGDEKGGDKGDGKHKEHDKQIFDTVKKVINAGADLFNKRGDPPGCYRLYQGALLVLQADLAHHPKLQEEIKKGLADAEKMAFVPDRAFAL